jgi:hypothetical protein
MMPSPQQGQPPMAAGMEQFQGEETDADPTELAAEQAAVA